MTGTVTLVSAGPSSKWLLTLKGAEALRNAEAVVYDRLIGEDILDLIPQGAEMINVGKENNHHPVPQDEINRILVRCAKEGKNTVRLKGGDSYLFGRGGEEVEFLIENDVPFRVIPGVSSSMAGPAMAGIPITHRDYASSVHIVTAHAKAGKELEINFRALVEAKGTYVFLMGLSALEKVMAGLLSGGIDPQMPAAVVENGTRGNQRKVVATVTDLPEKVRAAGLHSPALIVVGQVCSLSEQLDWFTTLPLHGKTIAVTRPRERAGTLAEKLRDLGANVVECPCIETVELQENPKLAEALAETADWVALTSPAGVHAMVHGLERCGKDLRTLWNCKFAAIGPGTAKELKKYGITADLIPQVYDSPSLAKALAETVRPSQRVLILRASQGAEDLPKMLEEKGIAYADVPTYETVFRTDKGELLQKLMEEGTLDVVTFTSASTVHGFVKAVGTQDWKFTALCIGQQTAAAAESYGMTVKVSKKATIDSMIDVLTEK